MITKRTVEDYEKIRMGICLLKDKYKVVTEYSQYRQKKNTTQEHKSNSIYFKTLKSKHVYRLSDHTNKKTGLNKVQWVVANYHEFLVCCERRLKVNYNELDFFIKESLKENSLAILSYT